MNRLSLSALLTSASRPRGSRQNGDALGWVHATEGTFLIEPVGAYSTSREGVVPPANVAVRWRESYSPRGRLQLDADLFHRTKTGAEGVGHLYASVREEVLDNCREAVHALAAEVGQPIAGLVTVDTAVLRAPAKRTGVGQWLYRRLGTLAAERGFAIAPHTCIFGGKTSKPAWRVWMRMLDLPHREVVRSWVVWGARRRTRTSGTTVVMWGGGRPARGSRARRSAELPEVLYHGRAVRSTAFDLAHVAGKEANDQDGPGFYFTSDPDDAATYAGERGIVLRARLAPRKLVPHRGRPNRAQVRQLVLGAPGLDEVLLDWGESRREAFAALLDAMYENPTPWEAFLAVWGDVYHRTGHDTAWLAGMVALGYDAVVSPGSWGGATHVVAFTPDVVRDVEVHRQTSRR